MTLGVAAYLRWHVRQPGTWTLTITLLSDRSIRMCNGMVRLRAYESMVAHRPMARRTTKQPQKHHNWVKKNYAIPESIHTLSGFVHGIAPYRREPPKAHLNPLNLPYPPPKGG
jgi:hypothetical protein